MNAMTQAVKEFFGTSVDLSHVTVVVENSFHNTSTRMWVNAETQTVTVDEVDRVARELCGMDDCSCGSLPLNCWHVVDANGEAWRVTE